MRENAPHRSSGKLRSLPVDRLERGTLQPRRAIDGIALRRLAESIRSEGVIQPIYVRKKGRGRFEIVAGERRWHAAKIAGLRQIPTIVGKVSDEAALAIALVENLHREDLNVIDQALAMQRLVSEFGMTHQEVADTVGRSRATVTNLLRLLESPAPIRELVASGELDMGHARALLALPNAEAEALARRAVGERLSVREVEARVKRFQAPAPHARTSDGGLPNATCLANLQASEESKQGIRIERENDGGYSVAFRFGTRAELESIIGELRRLAELLPPT